jgi:hypothetical protein
MTRDSSVGIVVTGYGWTELDFRQDMGIVLYDTASRPALGSTQPPIQWVPGDLSLELKRQGREADRSHPSNAEGKECVELYLHLPTRIHGVVLS